MPGKILILQEQVKSKAKELYVQAKEMEQAVSEMEEQVSSTLSCWQGNSSEKYRKEFALGLEKSKQAVVQLRGHPSTLIQITDHYTQAEAQVREMGEQLPSHLLQ